MQEVAQISEAGLLFICYVKYTPSEDFMFSYSGNIGPELSSTNLGMFITSDAGNSWRQVRPCQGQCWFALVQRCKCVLSTCAAADFRWGVQHLVSWQWRRSAGSLTRSHTDSTLMVGGQKTDDRCVVGWNCLGIILSFFFFLNGGWSGVPPDYISCFEILDGPSLRDYFIFRTVRIISTRVESVTVLYSCSELMVWVLLCKSQVEQGRNLRLPLISPSYCERFVPLSTLMYLHTAALSKVIKLRKRWFYLLLLTLFLMLHPESYLCLLLLCHLQNLPGQRSVCSIFQLFFVVIFHIEVSEVPRFSTAAKAAWLAFCHCCLTSMPLMFHVK